MTTSPSRQQPLPRSVFAPHSAFAESENAIANELVHVVHSWIADITAGGRWAGPDRSAPAAPGPPSTRP